LVVIGCEYTTKESPPKKGACPGAFATVYEEGQAWGDGESSVAAKVNLMRQMPLSMRTTAFSSQFEAIIFSQLFF
jgi:hypothetical protein